MLSKSFDYTLPDDVIAVKSFKIKYDHYGATMQVNHLSPVHQSAVCISNMDENRWFTDSYKEEVPEDPSKMNGFMDILSNAQAGHTI